jgi:xanthine/CO dehydrogenase XdhC/CoxF family maturation factor
MVLVTVYDTQGSTYSKAGAQMLIDADGKFHGMLSGGCLEGDLALRAEKVIETGETMSVAYDLSVDDDLWGLGVGCDGTMFVLLQRLSSDNEYQPFGAIADAMALDRPVRLAVVVESVTAAVAPGATIVSTEEQSRAFGADEGPAAELSTWLHGAGKGCGEVTVGGQALKVLGAALQPPHRLLVLGAGLDAEPVVRIACEMGWRCTVVDHRDAYVASGNFTGAEEVICEPAENLAQVVDLSRFDAAVVMSHHLGSDRSYLRQLAGSDIPPASPDDCMGRPAWISGVAGRR